MIARRLAVPVVVVCVLAGVLGLAVSPAFAFMTRPYEESFGLNGAAGSKFTEERPGALGIDQATGNIYVGDGYFDQSVSKYNLGHEPEPFTGLAPYIIGGRLTGFGFMRQLAVDSSTHVLYVAAGSAPVRAFHSEGEPADFIAGSGAGTNELPGSEVCGVAVDSSGDIYVSEYSTGVSIFAPSGQPLTKIAASGVCSLAIDSHGTVYAAGQGVERFTASAPPPVTSTTSYEAAGTIDPNVSFTLAIDPSTNHLLVDEGLQIAEYDETGARIGAFGSTEPGMLPNPDSFGVGLVANGASGRVYVGQGGFEGQVEVFGPAILLPDVTTGKASEIEPKGTATLNGTVNPDGVEVTECYFEYGASTSYGQKAACEPQAVGAGASEVPVSAKLKELEPGETYHFRLVASNKTAVNKHPANDGSDETFNTPPRPSIDATSTANLTVSSVDLNAQVNPGGLDTTYHIEYGTSAEYGTSVPVPDADIGAGSIDVSITQHVEGLSPNVTYHWRVVATNAAGTTTGVDHTFIYDTSGEALPDHRAYEMVTPPQKNGALVGDVLFSLSPDFSEDGSRAIMMSIQCFAGAESCTGDRQTEGEPFLFTRTSEGWSTKALAPPGRLEVNSAAAVSAEAGTALFSAPTSPTSEDDFYVRQADGSFVDIGPTAPPADGPDRPTYPSAATGDFTHLIYEGSPSLWSLTESTASTPLEYTGTGNQAPELVGVSGGLGSADLIGDCGAEVAGSREALPGRISADGETVYFTAAACGSGTGANAGVEVPVAEIYARIGEARTVAISEPAAFAPAAPYAGCEEESCVKDVNEKANWREATFVGGSVDGSKAFFTSSQKLTDDANSSEPNLYEHDFDSPGENVIDVSAAQTGGQGPRLDGVMAISSDGSHVYFVAQGVLTTTANALGQTATEGANNVYVFERDTSHPQGQVAFVAQLPDSDNQEWAQSGDSGYANVTPDGRFLVFESHADLTADDIRTDNATQIFRYDAQTGDLIRISIGQRGFDDNGNAGVGEAQIVQATREWYHAGPARSDPTMSHDGSFVFFESPIGLTPHALNDVQIATREEPYYGISEPIFAENVYEWHEGQVHLISDGKDTSTFSGESGSAVRLLGSDATGANVFFSTADSLVEQDTDTQIDYYDARICEPARGNPCISPSAPPLPSCLGEECHGTPAEAPHVPSAPTATFDGRGNVGGSSAAGVASKRVVNKGPIKCAKSKRRVRGKCRKAKGKIRQSGKAKSHRGSHR
ncbi:MAG TPA: hypothetical protein VNV42_10750 [Solirubrobacteraceae bacterium]|jgi:hypothetical protein|nr:hypothetical protein [Solirubrobacteraceae bacterium]